MIVRYLAYLITDGKLQAANALGRSPAVFSVLENSKLTAVLAVLIILILIHNFVLIRSVRRLRKQNEELQKVKSELLYLSYHDSLTGLYNRRFFEEELRRLDVKRNLPISMIMGDVNGLKPTNDIFGHAEGDLLLRKAADSMKKACRADDIIARLGGDEFVILLPRTKYEEAAAIAERIKKEFSENQIKGLSGSISLGWYTKTKSEEDIIDILDTAEEMMYAEKVPNRHKIDNDSFGDYLAALFESSPWEEEHANAVSKLCQDIGRAMELPFCELRELRDAGYVHDIGKIVLDKSLLHKKIAPDPAEWKKIKQHPEAGYRILHMFDDTRNIAEYVLHHHERWDGTGYPKGLKEEEIPLISRIIALAESYDAMTSKSGYKKPVSRDEAIREISRNAGSQFDPVIAGLFINILKEK